MVLLLKMGGMLYYARITSELKRETSVENVLRCVCTSSNQLYTICILMHVRYCQPHRKEW